MERVKAWLDSLRANFRPSGRPVVTLTYAQSLDGCLTAWRGMRYPLSGAETQKMTHMLRAAHDAILVGVGTILADNPHLTVRLAPGVDPRPVILDTHLRIPLDSRLLGRSDNLPWIACGPSADEEKWGRLEERKARIISCKPDLHKRIDLEDLLSQLYESGIHSLMVEGGASVITSFIEARLVDVVVLTIAPIWLGGLHAVETELSETQRLELIKPNSSWMGKDLVVWGAVRRDGG